MTSPVQEIAFFSYSREDSQFAFRLAKDLKDAGAAVWIDQLDIEPGQDWDIAVEAAVARCPRMLLVLSPISVQSRNVRNEIAFALDEKKSIIPVLYQDCMVPLQLRRVQHIDFRTDYEHGLKSLLKVLGVEQAVAASVAPVPATPKEAHPAPTDTGVRRLIAEQVELELQRRQAAEQARLEAEKKLAAERAALEEERRQLAATKEKLEKQERERLAAEQARLEEEQRQATERALEEERQRTEAQERLEQQRKQAAEQAWLEERRKQAVEHAQLEEERRQAAERARLEEERKQAAEQARLEEERKQAAAEKARLEQEKRERLAAAIPELSVEPVAEPHPSSRISSRSGTSIWGRALTIGVVSALWSFFVTYLTRYWDTSITSFVIGIGFGLTLGLFLKKTLPSFRWLHVAGMLLSWGLAGILLSPRFVRFINIVMKGPPLGGFWTTQILAAIAAGGMTALIIRRTQRALTGERALVIASGYVVAAFVSLFITSAGGYYYGYYYGVYSPWPRAMAGLALGLIGSGIMFWQLARADVEQPQSEPLATRNWGRAVLIAVIWALWSFFVKCLLGSGVGADLITGAGYGLSLGLFLKKTVPSFHRLHVAGMVLSWSLAGILLTWLQYRTGIWIAQIATGVVAGGLTALIVRRTETRLPFKNGLIIAAGYVAAALVSSVIIIVAHLRPYYYYGYGPSSSSEAGALAGLAWGFFGSGVMFWQLSKVRVKKS